MKIKIKQLLSLLISGIVLLLSGISIGKKTEKEKQQKQVIKNVKKCKTVDNKSYSDIISMYDKYE